MYAGEREVRPQSPVTVSRLQRMKRDGEKIAALTAYDYSFASVLESAGMDVILVGDSLGMVMQGRETTLPVTVDEIIYHSRCVAAGRQRALLMVDMPFMSYATLDQALANAARLMKEGGAHMVKLEGAGEQAELVSRLTLAGIPVCAHLGLQPQLVHKIGGYKVQGREDAAAQVMFDDARLLQDAGADALLLECVPAALAERISRALRIPVIGIGAGPGCDGQILVLQDMIGITPGRTPKFSRDFMQGQGSVQDAVAAYVQAVKAVSFPAEEHCF
ncbi:3-methyl-2-oxobutanoate hydroxymethyltransferase [Alkalilimnicola sp. S0819]|uniref:3-methyl-2-oxobutanoate hydroxymethyltransferase n=1 Tax=Alkalilimnicola sp. S0819 TaxID=2613922 RepID=UPI0012622FA8|nr:3-methyl-2-oxobutanoate hydroxymethyltransferase [Alkalilimnicola sp. S0819]KAB7628343.1 3-methyl-2-oxobutanoate hydroxymethyltransferase [Alkalilimnicola sp. S0819]MPQ15244.1 3-methyl-2-oxobutanoate hydroxymethyltransferase [Alkalilimnicola sp. S0819]